MLVDLRSEQWDVSIIDDEKHELSLDESSDSNEHTPSTDEKQVYHFTVIPPPTLVSWLVLDQDLLDAPVVILAPYGEPLRGTVRCVSAWTLSGLPVEDQIIIKLTTGTRRSEPGHSGSIVIRTDRGQCIGLLRGGSLKDGMVAVCVPARAQFNGLKHEFQQQAVRNPTTPPLFLHDYCPCSCLSKICHEFTDPPSSAPGALTSLLNTLSTSISGKENVEKSRMHKLLAHNRLASEAIKRERLDDEGFGVAIPDAPSVLGIGTPAAKGRRKSAKQGDRIRLPALSDEC